MSKQTVSRLREVGIIPIIRASSADAAVAVVEALLQAGLPVAEITMTVPNALDAIGAVAKRFPGKLLVGAGTVTQPEAARRAVEAGAEFIVTRAWSRKSSMSLVARKSPCFRARSRRAKSSRRFAWAATW